MIWKTILIEDEEPARERLKRLLKSYRDFEVAGEAANGIEGLELINTVQPDLVFLDIEMPGLNGFQVLKQLERQPRVIFTTAYDQYAVQAFEENAVDYLLKPIEKERLQKTVQKLRMTVTTHPVSDKLEAMIRQLQVKEATTLTVRAGSRILLVKLNEVTHLEAENKYVFLHMLDRERHLVDLTINGLAEQLPRQFLRIHRSYIINTDHIKEMRKSFNGTLVFYMNGKEGCQLTSSRANNELLRRHFRL